MSDRRAIARELQRTAELSAVMDGRLGAHLRERAVSTHEAPVLA